MSKKRNGDEANKPPAESQYTPEVDTSVAKQVEAAVAVMTKVPEAKPQQEVLPSDPDLEDVPQEGVDAYYAIMDAARAEAATLRKSAVNTIAVADQFKLDMLKMVDNIVNPMVIAAMDYQALAERTADRILSEARQQADIAIAFTKRLKGMSDAVRKHANGEEDNGGQQQNSG